MGAPAFGFISIGAACAAVLIIRGDRTGLRSGRAWWTAFGWVCATVFMLEPMRSAIDYGQIEVVLMFVIVADLLVVPAPIRGVILGLAAATKLTPFVFLLVPAVRGDWKSTSDDRSIRRRDGRQCGWWIRRYRTSSGPRTSMLQEGPGQLHIRGTSPGMPSSTDGRSRRRSSVWAALSLVTGRTRYLCGMAMFAHGPPVVGGHRDCSTGLFVSPISWSHHWVWVLLVPPLLVRTRKQPVPTSVRSDALGSRAPGRRRPVLVAEFRGRSSCFRRSSHCGQAPRSPRGRSSNTRGPGVTKFGGANRLSGRKSPRLDLAQHQSGRPSEDMRLPQ